jgi:predicted Ser/Thr protein kinase
VSVWVKKERIRNRVTGEYEEPDEKMMREVERLLETKGDVNDWRKGLISGIAAWAIDHPGQRVEGSIVFPQLMRRMREAIFNDRRPSVALLARDVVILVRDDGTGLDKDRRRHAEAVIDRMIAKFGYCRSCAGDAASMLVRRRFHDLVV